MQDVVTEGTVFVDTWRVELLPARRAPTNCRAPRRSSKVGSDVLLDDRGVSNTRAIAIVGDPAHRRFGIGDEKPRCLTGQFETMYSPAAVCERRAEECSKTIARSPMMRAFNN
jgi:hypothetical protein